MVKKIINNNVITCQTLPGLGFNTANFASVYFFFNIVIGEANSDNQRNLFKNCTGNLHCVKSVQIRSFFWSVFSCIRTEYGDLRSKSPYSVQIQENSDQKKLRYLDTFHAVPIKDKRREKSECKRNKDSNIFCETPIFWT